MKIIRRIIENYKPGQPFSRHLKDFFKTHPQMGSRDRKLAAGFTYNYFRIGKALDDLRMIERLTIANFLCSSASNPLLIYCIEKFSLLREKDIENSMEEKIEKIKQVYTHFNPEKIFPFSKYLGDDINRKKFISSFLSQPRLWIRIRRGFERGVKQELTAKNILFEEDQNNPSSVSLLNATSVEKTDSYLKGHFEIQDWSSQQTLNFIQPQPNEMWWDACSGSGGKSLMMFDAEPSLKILASDKRLSILKNLVDRFEKIDTMNLKIMELDLLSPPADLPAFNGIVADVPCSGSGTWARTPEWLTMFDENSISQFVSIQRNIIKNLTHYLKPGTPLVYITCSVFKEENEKNIEWIEENMELTLQKSAYLEGYSLGADTMFAARLIKR